MDGMLVGSFSDNFGKRFKQKIFVDDNEKVSTKTNVNQKMQEIFYPKNMAGERLVRFQSIN